MLKEVIIVKNYHPNEHVACYMADCVCKTLNAEHDQTVKPRVVDLEKARLLYRLTPWAKRSVRNPFGKYKDMDNLFKKHPDATIFDMHDTPVEAFDEIPLPREPYLFTPPFFQAWRGRHAVIEYPAVYVPQEDKTIRKYATDVPLDLKEYYLSRSDVDSSITSNVLRPQEHVQKATRLIVNFLKRNT